MSSSPVDRPPLTPTLGGNEFLRWYWVKQELVEFARLLSLRVTGGKETLVARIAAHLDGRAFTEPPSARLGGRPQLTGPLVASTIVPEGQRCSQVIRAWLTDELGSSFHFDAAMREFFSAADGTQTLQDALDHWNRTRDAGKLAISSQFEYNRFTRGWYTDHPSGDRAALIRAWREYRSRPVEDRARE